MIASIVPIHDIDKAWPMVSKSFSDCLEETHGDCSAGDLWTLCRSGQAMLMIAYEDEIKGASVWRFENWLEGTVLRCLILAGDDMASWFQECSDLAEAVARNGGAKSFVWDGRKGWAKVFKDAEIIRHTYRMKI